MRDTVKDSVVQEASESTSVSKTDLESVGPSHLEATYLRALQDPRHNVYLGSVPDSVRDQRRRANKVAGKSRRANRGR